ncbi:MAG: Cd(II)/Pb(II)-responsive transcriptional regulator [Thermoleophilia bacterium]
MRIGELARMAGSTTETVRYYERLGLLPAPQRTEANYRVYDAGHLERLRFIRNCRAVGITLEEIKSLLHHRDNPTLACGDVNELIDAHLEQLEAQIAALTALRGELSALRARCSTPRTAAECGILAGLGHSEQV